MPNASLWALVVSLIILVVALMSEVIGLRLRIKEVTQERNAFRAQVDALKDKLKKKDVPAAGASMEPEKRLSVWDPDWRPKFKR